LWIRFLHQVTNGDIELQAYLQRLAGYSLIGEVLEHVLVFLYGTGGNGKGVFLNTLTHVLGDYAVVAPADMLVESRNERHPTDMAMLRGARLVTAQEIEQGRAWAEAKIKALTGGDPVTARFMRQDFFTYVPQFTLLVAANHKPKLHVVDEAMRRRLHMVPFIVKVAEPDLELPGKLRAEASGILQWAIEGCLDWQRNHLAPPASVLDLTKHYFEEQDPLSRWLEECCDITEPTAWTGSRDLLVSYNSFTNDGSALDSNTFAARLDALGYRRDRRRVQGSPAQRLHGYNGIRLLPE
jgi:putative DNA primase/helicase